MCGIAGVFRFSKQNVQKETLQRMTGLLKHRGPDGSGFYLDKNLGLGHRRLSILDLSEKGKQPMISKDSRLAIAYNGEVYNYRELRLELQRKGYRFASNTDTEVILYAYHAWGAKCVERFNGMFAFVIWDKKRRELFLARDRYGIKPLYYAYTSDMFLFASEQKAILAEGNLERRLNYEALLEYFTFQNIFTAQTLFEGVQMFPAGSWAILREETQGGKLRIEKYWDFDFQEPQCIAAEEEYIEELDRLFRQAVRRQLVSDVAVGAYLSGGMDSGAIVSIAAQELPYMKTFTCGFDLHSASGLELGYDEREKAEYMSYLFKTEHYEMVLKAGDMERVLPTLAWHLEEPRVGQSYPNYYAAQLASKFVKVVLSGGGGDELFAGYPWRYYRAVVNDDFENYIDKYYTFWQRLLPNRLLKDVFRPIWHRIEHVWTRDIFKNVFENPKMRMETPEDYVNQSLYFEAKTFLHGLLVVEDKLSMAHGVETRLPFLDNDLVDFAMRLPARMKLKNLHEVVRFNENETGGKTEKYFIKTRDGKQLLRKAMRFYMPDSVTKAVKQGFSAPDASWFRGDSIEYVKRILSSNALLYQFMDRNTVQALVEEHLTGKMNRRLFIWSLLSFEHWCKAFYKF